LRRARLCAFFVGERRSGEGKHTQRYCLFFTNFFYSPNKGNLTIEPVFCQINTAPQVKRKKQKGNMPIFGGIYEKRGDNRLDGMTERNFKILTFLYEKNVNCLDFTNAECYNKIVLVCFSALAGHLDTGDLYTSRSPFLPLTAEYPAGKVGSPLGSRVLSPETVSYCPAYRTADPEKLRANKLHL